MKATGIIWWFLAMASLLVIPASDATYYQYQDSGNSEIRGKILWMENEIKNTIESGCSIQTDSLATYIQTIWWPHIQYLASRTSPQEQQQILMEHNRLQYMLGLKKCQSPHETLYQGQCHRIGIPGNPCPQYQQLYNKPDNTGYCYCQRSVGNSNGLIYMDGNCYKQNEQGPCDNGEWLTVKGHTPRCEQVPRGCPADGRHIYWSCNDGATRCPNRRIQTNNQKRCSRIGSVQPSCGAGAKLIRNGMKAYCGSPKMIDWKEPNVGIVLPPAKTCQQSNVQPVEEENILETDINISDEDLFLNIANDLPCPNGFYRGIDGLCSRLPEQPGTGAIATVLECPSGYYRDRNNRCRRKF